MQNTPVTGVFVIEPFSNNSIPNLKTLVIGSRVLSNFPLGMHYAQVQNESTKEPNQFCQRVFQAQGPNPVDALQAVTTMSNRLVIVSPTLSNAIPFALQVAEHRPVDFVRILVGDSIYSLPEAFNLLDSETKHKYQETWDNINGTTSNSIVAPVTEYTEEDLFQAPNGARLFPYQQQMADFAIKNKRVGLFVDMGLGKTFATLAAIDQLNKQGNLDVSKPILIVAPKLVASDTWAREADKWGYDFDVAVNVALTPKKREKLLTALLEPLKKVTLLTTNPQQLKAIQQFFYEHGQIDPFQMIVVDELSQFKTPDTNRFNDLRRISDGVEYFFGLTGTPNPNNMLDVWAQLMVIDPHLGNTIEHDYYSFRSKYFEPDVQGKNPKTGQLQVFSWKLKPFSKNKILDAMKPSVISMLSEGRVDLPSITYTNKYVKMPLKAKKFYKELDENLRRQIREAQENNLQDAVSLTSDGVTVSAPNEAVLKSRLVQVTSGMVYDGVDDLNHDFSKNLKKDSGLGISYAPYSVLHKAKIEALKEIIDTATSPILVFFQYKSELVELNKHLDFEYLNPKDSNAPDLIKRWNEGKVPVMLAHPAAAGHGLNLQDGGHTMVWYTTTWSNEQYRQAVKRLYRRGQKNTVSVIHLTVEGTVDEEIISRLDQKEEQQSELLSKLEVNNRKDF